MARLRSLIRPGLISPRTKLIRVPTIGLPTVITLKIPLNQGENICATAEISAKMSVGTSLHMSLDSEDVVTSYRCR